MWKRAQRRLMEYARHIIMISTQRKYVIAAAILLAIVLAIGLVVGGVWFWGILKEFIKPDTPTEKKDLVQVFAFIVAGVVGSLTALAAVGNVYISTRNLKQQRDFEKQRVQADALTDYFVQMGQSLLNKDRAVWTPRMIAAAETQTRTVLARLDGENKRPVLQFLYDSVLIKKDDQIINLFKARLNEADLIDAYLREVDLSNAVLREANLRDANLKEANLHHANLKGANLTEADLTEADLTEADLSGADLRNALGWTCDQLLSARSLKGATMPTGEKVRTS
jgi:hypothetical protein